MAGASSQGPVGRTGTPPHTKDGTTPKILTPVPGSVRVQPTAFAGVDTEPPPVGSMDFIRLWTYRGKPVVYEYRNGARVTQLTYPNKDGRPFYQVDDFVLVSEIEKSSAERIFPELQEPDQGVSFISIIMLFLGEFEEAKYKIGWKITDIAPNGRSGGVVKMQGVLFLDSTPTSLQKTADFGRQDLNDSFVMSRTAAQLEATIVPLCRLTAELVMISLSGSLSALKKTVGKRLLKASARQAMEMGLRKAFNRLLRSLATVMGKCTLAFLSAMAKQAAKDIDAQLKQQRLKAHVGAATSGQAPDLKPLLEKAIVAGADGFASTLIKEGCEATLMKFMDKSFREIFPGERALSDRIKIYVSKEVVKLCTTESATAITDSLLSAWKDSIDAHGKVDYAKFEKLVADKLKANLEKALTSRAKKWGEGFSEEQFKEFAR